MDGFSSLTLKTTHEHRGHLLSACSVAAEAGQGQWQQGSSCAEHGLGWHTVPSTAAEPTQTRGGAAPAPSRSPESPALPKPRGDRSQITDHSPCAEPSGETRAPSLSPGLSAHTGQGAKLTNTTYFGHLSFTLPKHSATFRLERL